MKSIMKRFECNFIFGNQGSYECWKSLRAVLDIKFDFIVEDGSHQTHDMLCTLYNSLDLLKVNGYYFMEDIQDPITTAGKYGYDNTSIYKTIQEFRDTGKFYNEECSHLTPDMCKEIGNKIELVEMFYGGHKDFRNIMAVFKRKNI